VATMETKIRLAKLARRGPLAQAANRVARLVGPVVLNDLHEQASVWTQDPDEVIHALAGEPVPGAVANEWPEVARAQAALFSGTGNYPAYFGVEGATARMLYGLTRSLRPQVVVEVGVADGRSTHAILAAMDNNRAGRLVSVDVRDDVGAAVRGHQRWQLRVHSGTSVHELPDLLRELGPVDMYWHDAMHTYEYQAREYLVGLAGLRANGVFISDDVDQSNAFLDVCQKHNIHPVILMESRRAVGAFRT
jgi:predicted O-methyltransferase YrrM